MWIAWWHAATPVDCGGVKLGSLFFMDRKLLIDAGSTSTTMNSTSRVRVPWPGSRHKESPNQHHYLTSPRGSTATAVSQLDSVTEFLEAAIHFPKQQKSPSTLRRVPRKKTLRKSKVKATNKKKPHSRTPLDHSAHGTSLIRVAPLL